MHVLCSVRLSKHSCKALIKWVYQHDWHLTHGVASIPREVLFYEEFCEIAALILNSQKFQTSKSNVSLKIRNVVVVFCSYSLSKPEIGT